jgi:hypothetical protein
MRSVLALALLIVLAAPADARTAHHRTRHHVFSSPGAASSYHPYVPSPGWGYDPYNDPSKFGGA